MAAPPPPQVTVRVPATTANLGPGFDCLGVALRLYNRVTVRPTRAPAAPSGMIAETGRLFFEAAKLKPYPYEAAVRGKVPRSRGLGSSVTVRLGILAALNEAAGRPLADETILDLLIQLEGHPDNAVPAFHGGFAACAPPKFVNLPVDASLKFIALVPEFELETAKARRVLPARVPRADAIHNLQRTALLTAAFAARTYPALAGLFDDRLHQPYRSPLVPFLEPVIHAAHKAGALGAFLSGAGPTVMAVSTGRATAIREAMAKACAQAGTPASTLVLTADNDGLVVEKSR